MIDAADFDDNNFLQNWLESRYGCGVAQGIMDDLGHHSQDEHKEEILENKEGATVSYDAPYCAKNGLAANDNPYLVDWRKMS